MECFPEPKRGVVKKSHLERSSGHYWRDSQSAVTEQEGSWETKYPSHTLHLSCLGWNYPLAMEPPQKPEGATAAGAVPYASRGRGQWVSRDKGTISHARRSQIYFLPWIAVTYTYELLPPRDQGGTGSLHAFRVRQNKAGILACCLTLDRLLNLMQADQVQGPKEGDPAKRVIGFTQDGNQT